MNICISFLRGEILLEKSRFERLRTFLHEKPLWGRLKAKRALISVLWFVFFVALILFWYNFSGTSETLDDIFSWAWFACALCFVFVLWLWSIGWVVDFLHWL